MKPDFSFLPHSERSSVADGGKRGRAKPWKNRTPDLRCPHCGRAVIVTEYVYYHVSKGGGKVKRF